MKSNIIFFACLLFSFSTRAQKQPVRYEALDSLSAIISKLAVEVDGRGYVDSKTGEITNLSFPKENFVAFYYNKLATKVIYKLGERKETSVLVQGVDLTNMIGITQEEVNHDLIVVKLYYKGNEAAKAKAIAQGDLLAEDKDYLEFYGPNKPNDHRLFNSLSYLCGILQLDNGSLTRQNFIQDNADWKKLTMAAYLQKHPASLRAMQARFSTKNIAAKQAAQVKLYKQLEVKKVALIDSLCKFYKFKPSLSKTEFSAYNEEAAQFIKAARAKVGESGTTYVRKKIKKISPLGTTVVKFNTKDILVLYNVTLAAGSASAMPYFSAMAAVIKQQFPADYIKATEDEYHIHTLKLTSPHSKVIITMTGYTDTTQAYGMDISGADIAFTVD